MMYSILIYGEAGLFEQLPQEAQDRVMAGHRALQAALGARGDYASIKLMPPTTAVTVTAAAEPEKPPLVVDGPFAETKEAFLGFYAADFADLDDALAHAQMISSPFARLEVRPIAWAGGVLTTDAPNVGVA